MLGPVRLGALCAALLALLLPAVATAADPLSYRLGIVSAAARGAQAEARALGLPAQGPGSLNRLGDDYITEIRYAGAPPAARLRAAGAKVLHISRRYRTITAAIAREDLRAAADVAGVEAVTEVQVPMSGRAAVRARGGAVARRRACATGSQVSEGDTQLRAAIARADLNLDGAGVKVGILSDSFSTATLPATTAAQDVTAGDLPGPANPCGRTTPVSVVKEGPANRADEGRAMLQIVHDLAPGADLAFATAAVSETDFADQIIALKDAGADVIADDFIFFAEPFFQDGPIANSVSTVTDAGVPYFTMAFNNNQIDASNRDIASWETAQYRPIPCPTSVQADNNFVAGSDCMDFDPDPVGTDSQFSIGLTNSRLSVVLQWNEPRLGVTDDFDLYLLNAGAVTAAESHNVNGTTQIPFETAFLNPTISGTREVVIMRRAGSLGTPRIKFEVNNNAAKIDSFEYPTGGGVDIVGPAIYGHNGTAKAQTVGAIDQAASTQPEFFSSRGPVTHYFGPVAGGAPAAALGSPEVLSKPDVTASDNVINTFFDGDHAAPFRFTGTSAAAPHAAAIAALQLQANPGLTPTQVKSAQRTTATAIGAFGPLVIGSGLIDARAAVALNALPPVITPSGLPAVTADTTPSVSFTANRQATFTCQVDTGTVSACTSPFTVPSALAEGDHTITIAATDLAAHTGSIAAPVRIDLTGPVMNIGTGPSGPTNVASPTFSFSGNETVASAECRFDAAAFAPCTTTASHVASTTLADGDHTFEVRGTDVAGNQGAATSRAFTVDTVAPETPSITGGPTGAGASATPTFTFTAAAGATTQCRFDSDAFAVCSGAGTHTPATALANGPHTFAVQALDAAGNVSPGATRAFTVGAIATATPTATATATATVTVTPDTTKPVLSFTTKPKKQTTKRKAKFVIASSEPLGKLECKLDKGAFKLCATIKTVKVKPGKHTFRVRGTDAAGNVSAEVKVTWKVKRKKA
jgi:hypothetical protein